MNKQPGLQHLQPQATYANGFGLVRFMLASLVIWNHSFYFTGHFDDQLLPGRVGNETAMFFRLAIFFTISGYLVTRSLNSKPGYLHWLWKRFIRLWPALTVAILGAALVLGPLVTQLPLGAYFTHPQFREYLWGLSLVKLHHYLPGVFTHNMYPLVNASLWSLQYELIFYFVLLVLYSSGVWKHSLTLGIVLLAAWVLMGVLFYNPAFGIPGSNAIESTLLGIKINHRIFMHFLLFFMAGGWLATQGLYRVSHWVAAACAIVLATTLKTQYFSYLLNIAMPPLVLYLCTQPRLTRFYKLTAPLGNYSYSLFIYAFPIQQVVIQYLGNTLGVPAQFGLAYAATLLLSIASWHLVEAPALRLKNIANKYNQ